MKKARMIDLDALAGYDAHEGLAWVDSLDITLDVAAELLTDGGNDASVDGLHVGDVDDGAFLVTLFQGKYKRDLAYPLCLMEGV